MHPITIIGTGLAGYTVARELRKFDKESPLRLITADEGHFYSKPMLSNAFAKNKTPDNLVTMPVTKMAEQINAEILTHTRVTQIIPQQHALETKGKHLKYSQLVLAGGAEPIHLPLAGTEVNKVLFINDLDDYARFRIALQDVKRVAIMGSGLIGCEFANDLRQGGFEVTLIVPRTQILRQLVPPIVAKALQTALTDLGVTLSFGKTVTRVDQGETGYRLTFTDDSILETDIVLSAVGLRPRTELAAAAGLSVEQGIVVDRYLQTSAKDVYALGDCAQVEGLVLLFIMPLMNAASALAKTLTGQPTPVTYPAMPIVVKTPACPIVVSPPAAGFEGEWQIEGEGQNLRALFYSPDQQMGGFVLTGRMVAEKMALTKKLPPVWA
jgi:rubredoxin-NAD+ reductase